MAGLQIINFTPGIKTNADYTYPEMSDSYKSSEWIIQSLKQFAIQNKSGLNGSIILIHAGTYERRKDKLYNRLNELIDYLKSGDIILNEWMNYWIDIILTVS